MLRGLLLLCLLLTASARVQAQAFDGDFDWKLYGGYTLVGSHSGAEIGCDYGLNDWLSFGGKVSLFFVSDGSDDDHSDLIERYNFGFHLDAHGQEAFHLSSPVDVYAGIGLGFKVGDAHAGVRYNFGEVVGCYLQVQYNAFKTFGSPEDAWLYKDKFAVSAGLTFNL